MAVLVVAEHDNKAIRKATLNAVAAAQKAFHHRAHMNGLAAQGLWKQELEKQAA